MKKMVLVCVSMLAVVSIGCSGGKSASSSSGDNYPTKPIMIIIPYGPGGGSDVLTRTLMKYIELPNGQNFVAQNVEGAAGYIGAKQGENSKNDGYIILQHNPIDVVSYTLNGTTDEPLWQNIDMIAGVVNDYNVLVSNPKNSKIGHLKTVEEVAAYAKANPGLKCGVTGYKNGNFGDALRVFRGMGVGDAVTVIPYDGGAASRAALLGNHIDFVIDSLSDLGAMIHSEDVTALVLVGANRAKALPNIPTTDELGYGIVTTKPRGYYAPKGMDPAQFAVLQKAFEDVTKNPDFVADIENLGLEVSYVAGADMQDIIGEWIPTMQPIFDEMNAMD